MEPHNRGEGVADLVRQAGRHPPTTAKPVGAAHCFLHLAKLGEILNRITWPGGAPASGAVA